MSINQAKKITQTFLDLYIEATYSNLTILSFGGGQDSTTILFKLVLDDEFRAKYIAPDGKLLVLMADTHTEHNETYQYLDEVIIPFCKEHNIDFLKIDNTMGYHGDTWQSLTGQWENNKPTIGSMAYNKTCTHNLKLVPQFKYVEQWLSRNYSRIVNKKNKENYKQFVRFYGKIRWLVGIAKGEEKRVAKPNPNPKKDIWRQQSIEMQYPLIDFGLNRQACQDYIKSIGKPIPIPSNCLYCPFSATHMELLWLERYYPDNFLDWVKHEQKKLDAWEGIDKNLGVCARVHRTGEHKGQAFTLLDLLKEAKEKYGDISNEQLWEYKLSHGHCVGSTY